MDEHEWKPCRIPYRRTTCRTISFTTLVVLSVRGPSRLVSRSSSSSWDQPLQPSGCHVRLDVEFSFPGNSTSDDLQLFVPFPVHRAGGVNQPPCLDQKFDLPHADSSPWPRLMVSDLFWPLFTDDQDVDHLVDGLNLRYLYHLLKSGGPVCVPLSCQKLHPMNRS